MAYGVPFTDYLPGARTDNVAWKQVRVRESPAADGPWTEIDVLDLTPVDVNPAQPASRSFTATHATLVAGWYEVTFLDGVGGEQPAGIIYNGVTQTMPALRDIARLNRARTTGDGGELGTFTAATNPTSLEVEALIVEAAGDVTSMIGREIPPGAWDLTRRVVTFGTALLLEAGSEQLNTARYDRLKTLYDERVETLLDAVQDTETGGDPGGVDDRAMPLGTFPCPTRLDW